ncbi:hypothetical protein LDENG_00012310, partial [Lucifuga dentata]
VNSTCSFWSTDRCKPTNSGRSADHSVLASVPKTGTRTHNNSLRLSLFNIRSLSNKAALINELIMDSKLDILCLTETWQQQNDFLHLNQATPPGFVYFSKPRSSGRGGGGLTLIYRETLKITPVPVTEPSTCEILAVQLNGPTPTIVAVIYRPPKPSTAFLPELTSILINLCALSPNVILMGDFNFHLDNPTNALTIDSRFSLLLWYLTL